MDMTESPLAYRAVYRSNAKKHATNRLRSRADLRLR
jgi:hypothetical protein